MRQSNDIHALELAAGLKDLLINKGFFTLSQLLETPASELASLLGTDDYFAKLVISAAQRRSETITEHFS